MKRTRRVLAMLALALLAVSMVFASGQGESTASGDNTPDVIKARGTLNVGVKSDVPGFGLLDVVTGEYSGIEIDMAKLIAESLGLGADDVSFTTVTAATRGQLLDSGDIDMVIATFTITDERKLSWNFTTPYYTDAVSLLVKSSGGIRNYADLSGKVIGVSTGSTSKQALIASAVSNGISLNDDNFREFATYPEIKAALDSGRVDAFCVDGSILAGYVDSTTEILSTIRFSPQNYGIATKLSNTELASYVEDLVTTWLSDGTMARLIEENGVVASFTE